MGDYEDIVKALQALGEAEGWERPGRAFAEAVRDVWKQRYLHARKLRPWSGMPRDEALPLPVWAKTLSERLDHAEVFQGDDGQFLVAAHPYDIEASWWRTLDRLCQEFEVQWRISAQSWYFPTGSLHVEIAPKLEGLNIITWHGILNLDDAQIAEETAQRNRKRLRLIRPQAPEKPLTEEERRKQAAIQRMEANTLLAEILQREPRLVSIMNEAKGQRAFPGYSRAQTYHALKARASRLVGMEAENKTINTSAHYEAIMSTIAELLPLDAADRGETPPPADEDV